MKIRVHFFIHIALLLLLFVGFQFGTPSTADQPETAGMIKIGNFYMDRYEYPNIIGELPVTNITWAEATAMCEAIGKRLCTPEEWVRACRGPQGLRYPYGPTYDPTKCNSESQVDRPQRIGETPSTCVSGYGVYDLNGNVWEWVGTSLDQEVSIRGGAWSSSSCAECALKFWEHKPEMQSDRVGFRCCK
jgi:formylglycine-generating enzyme required for sulfatase activity